MFDFLDNDIFVIVINIAFLIFIIYDIKKYKETQHKALLVNIALTLGFLVWVMIPFYNKYITWDKKDITLLSQSCDVNATMCACLTDSIIKAYSFEGFTDINKQSSGYLEFLKESKKECHKD